MINPLTTRVESYMGAIFVSVFAAFFIGLMFISMKNFGSDISVITSSQAQVKTISAAERILIQNWIKENDIEIAEKTGYRQLLEKYPSRPWIK